MGYELYSACALNLAMSIKAYAPKVNITLIHDESINKLTEKEKSFFDILLPVKNEDFIINGKPQYQRLKVCVDQYSPYDKTLYIDVDSIWFPNKDINKLFDGLDDREFWIGFNGDYDPKTKIKTNKNYTYWCDPPKRACDYFKLENKLPQTISGVFYFKKGEFSQNVFDLAREVYDDENAPHIRWAAGKPDEYCFNIALSKLNFTQEQSHILYFDKVNGKMANETIYSSFWGLAAGGNMLQEQMKRLYNDLVDLYSEYFDTRRHYHIDKKTIIPERLSNV